MFTKPELKRKFAQDWKKQYEVELFREKGFVRKTCKCGKNFWTLDPDRKLCGDSSCEPYSFIGSPVTKVRWDYIETWKQFEKFFVKNGHISVKRYPVVDRWRPDLFFTQASIQDFQRLDKGKMVFEFPSDPLIVPQMCLRFNDIPNVGVTGRHHTSFIMPGQHSFGNYWKDRCIELNFRFLNGVMGIPENQLTYIEDVWAMGDFSAFGPCVETFSAGNELVNSVFMQYTRSGDQAKELARKVIDVGWGHERLAWFSNGTPTTYDVAFGPVMKWMKKQTGFKDTDIFDKYSMLAGNLNLDEVQDITAEKMRIAKMLGIEPEKLREIIEPMQALYAIADHTKSLLFAITDGSIPSNVGGGYNLRALLRRALSFINEFKFDLDMQKIAEMHAKHLKPMFPELKEGAESLSDILSLEKERHEKSIERGKALVLKELKRGKIGTGALRTLYTSHGVSPETVEKIAKNEGIEFEVPEDFYVRLTDEHSSGEKETEKDELSFDVSKLPETKRLYYDNPEDKEFRAKVIKVFGEWVVLDQTLFYPTGGGQPSDTGTLSAAGKPFGVSETQKIGDVILHRVRGLKEGQEVKGMIDWERRFRLMQMHTATHIVAGIARNVIGRHIWQAGAKKGLDSSRIDLTHYKPFTEKELDKIEEEANRIAKKGIQVDAKVMDRGEAEGKYGFILYQGGASPGKKVRVVSIKGVDVEACGGTHLLNTKHVESIKIVRADRIQDGVNRLEYTAGDAARKFEKGQEELFRQTLDSMEGLKKPKLKFSQEDLKKAAAELSVDSDHLPSTVKKFVGEILSLVASISKMERDQGRDMKLLEERSLYRGIEKSKTLHEACSTIFELWKQLKKDTEKLQKSGASDRARSLIAKAKDNEVFEIIHVTRKGLIDTADQILKERPELSVILANEAGNIVGMSRTKDMAKAIREICSAAGGSGGGSPELAQGKAELSKLIKIMRQ